MNLGLFYQYWRRKFSIILLAAFLILLGLWTWALFGTNSTLHTGIWQNPSSNAIINQRVYLIQKLVAQANRMLRLERQKDEVEEKVAAVISPAVAHKSGSSATGILRFAKPTGGNKQKSLTLVERSKKSPIVGESFLFEEERLKILENQQRMRNAGVEELNNNNMDDETMLSSAERQTQYEHELQRMGVPAIAGIGPETPRAPNERLVHLDLKGAPPKLSYLTRILPTLRTLGATGLLIEYEDIFPYSGELNMLAARNAYSPNELRDFLQAATGYGLSIMPLVQTFGHLEYALKLPGFEHLREIRESPQSLCPSQPDSMPFIQRMVRQVIEFHLGHGPTESNSSSSSSGGSISPYKVTHIHIGCDEVFRMGECDACKQHSRNELFLTHVTTIANFIRTHWPQLHVVIWDDMLRDMTLSEMQHSHIGSYVEPMIWVYVSDIYHFIQPQLWEMYSKVFPTAWAASAFKGAFGESLMLPPLQRHLENNIHWLAVIAREGGRFSKGFRGLALTGWQRYDHFAVLCELFPVGIPSLITTLSTVSKGYFSTNAKENSILKVLDCAFHPDSRRSGHPWIEFHPNSHHSQLFLVCNYPGSMIYKYALRLNEKLVEAQNYLVQVQDKSAWMSDYNVRHNFSSSVRVSGLTAHTPTLIHELTGMAREAQQLMFDVFDEYTIGEFVEQQIYPFIVKLRGQMDRAEILLKPQTWSQRPLPYTRQLLDWNLISSAGSTLADDEHNQNNKKDHSQ